MFGLVYRPLIVLTFRSSRVPTAWYLKEIGIDSKLSDPWDGKCYWAKYDSERYKHASSKQLEKLIFPYRQLVKEYLGRVNITAASSSPLNDQKAAHDLTIDSINSIRYDLDSNRFPNEDVNIQWVVL